MRRYNGENLGSAPRIAVVANDAIGNFVVGTPLLQMLRSKWNPSALDYYGGTRTWELIEASDLIDFGYPLHGAPPNKTAEAIAERAEDGAYSLVVNMEWTCYAKAATAMLAGVETFVCGPSVGNGGRGDLAFGDDSMGKLWSDQEWVSPEITNRYPQLKSGFIGEIFCRLAYLEGEVPGYRLPKKRAPIVTPPVLIATAASLPEKLWTQEKWIDVLGRFHERGLEVGLIGAPPASQRQFWQGDSTEGELVERGLVTDLRGKLSLPEVVWALSNSKLVFSLDNGVMHLAAGSEAPVVGLFRKNIARLWAPARVNVIEPENRDTVAEIPVDTVWSIIEKNL
ncbi:MAG: glycosyltransferase family 9 protein [Chthonomonas sp.]|nr:glycosyltransferase family 9 protein [Chthonomonas sp.]